MCTIGSNLPVLKVEEPSIDQKIRVLHHAEQVKQQHIENVAGHSVSSVVNILNILPPHRDGLLLAQHATASASDSAQFGEIAGREATARW